MKEFKVGIIGFGTVGAGVASCLLNNADTIAKRTGVKPVLTKIGRPRYHDRPRGQGAERHSDDGRKGSVDEVDVVVELIGGTTNC